MFSNVLLKYFKYSLLLFIFVFKSYALGSQPNAYLIKAIYFEKFSRFTEWPYSSDVKNNTFNIAIIGVNSFEGLIQEMYKNQKIIDKKVKVKYIDDTSKIYPAQILFIGKVTDTKLKEVLEYTCKRPILTISENSGYAQKGVLINFYLYANKIRFEINESAVKKSGLTLDFRLLSFAKIINPIKNNQ